MSELSGLVQDMEEAFYLDLGHDGVEDFGGEVLDTRRADDSAKDRTDRDQRQHVRARYTRQCNSPLTGRVEVRRGDGVEVVEERAGSERPGVVGNGQKLVEGRAWGGSIVESQDGDRGGSIDTNESNDDLSVGVSVVGGEVLDGSEGGRDLSSVVVDETTPDLADGDGFHDEVGDDTLNLEELSEGTGHSG